MSFINGGGSQMPMMISSSGSLCMLAIAGAGIFWYLSTKDQSSNTTPYSPIPNQDEPETNDTVPSALNATTYRLHSGSLGMDSDCSRAQVQMKDKNEENSQQWKAVPVPGKANVYNLLSNQRSLSGCPAYLTADSTCNGTSLESPQYLDRQEFEVLGGEGQPKQIRSVACKNKNLQSYIKGDQIDAGLSLQRKSGTAFTFDPIA